ncbi:MAG: 30S ribosomal protein S16 [Crocinitomicaceae bacterium]|nr:30S ribosomal protein S16 [Crocinitomicaceae bacterium]
MAVKIRLQRHGKKGKPFYHIVAADARAKRDGRYIEKIGTYNPTTNPASIDLKIDRAVNWLQNGAVPTDTARAILSYKGALYKNHLVNGVRKGAFDEAEAEKRFENWATEKSAKISSQAESISKGIQEKQDAIFTAEKAQNEARIKEIAAKNSALAAEVAVEESAAEAVAEEPAAEETAEAAAKEPAAEAVAEEPAAEAVAEEPAAEAAAEEPAAEAAAEEPAAEATAEEPAAEEPAAEAAAEEPAAEAAAEEPASEETAEEPAAEETAEESTEEVPAEKDDSKSEE